MNQDRAALSRYDATYQAAMRDADKVPWAEGRPKPLLADWLGAADIRGDGRRALVVGSGLGDDAEALAARGFAVTAFDLSPTAIAWTHERFPDSAVSYHVADLFDLPADWQRAFDLVVEIYTLQSLPPTIRPEAMDRVAALVAPGGELLVICRGREEHEPAPGPPYPLSRAELRRLEAGGLVGREAVDRLDDETPPVRRFRLLYRRG
ncbi:MAG: class I SAM-dependent methyltransferase [Candidatus Latescibacteria bacterium]|nr:class I SAM-dependent methyltransferase [Candidatus Latescibacterota bacterium]